MKEISVMIVEGDALQKRLIQSYLGSYDEGSITFVQKIKAENRPKVVEALNEIE